MLSLPMLASAGDALPRSRTRRAHRPPFTSMLADAEASARLPDWARRHLRTRLTRPASGNEAPAAGLAKSRTPRVLVVMPTAEMGGAERMAVDLVRELRRQGVVADLFLMRRSGSLLAEAESVCRVLGPAISHGRFRYLLFLTAVSLPVAARSYDLIVGGLDDTHLVSYNAARLAAKPVVALVHTDIEQNFADIPLRIGRRAIGKFLYPRMDWTVGVSKEAAASALGYGAPRARTSIIENGIDFARVRAGAAEAADGGWDKSPIPVVLAVGRLHRHKGLDLLIRAHAHLGEGVPRHRVVIIGEGEARAELERLISSLGVHQSVELRGLVRNPYPFLRTASVLCLPSRLEGFGLVLVEALVLGTPVISTRCPGAPEILGGGAYGDLVEPESVDAIADALRRHLRDPERLRAKARAAASEQPGRYTITAAAARYKRLFEALLNPSIDAKP
jgi:glycosyltransferase involved in cell wall biosynthesis